MQVDLTRRAMLFAGSCHPELATAIAAALDIELSPVEISRFASGEIYVRFLESVRGCDAFVIQTHGAPVNDTIMEQLIMIDALKRASAARINAVIPYFGYARQDKKSLAREPISARLVARPSDGAARSRRLCAQQALGRRGGGGARSRSRQDGAKVRGSSRLRHRFHAEGAPRGRAQRLRSRGADR
jgi:N-terminal domain of ribose phosphate pyrophosphokinase